MNKGFGGLLGQSAVMGSLILVLMGMLNVGYVSVQFDSMKEGGYKFFQTLADIDTSRSRGFTVLSADEISYKKYDTDLMKEVWAMTLSADGSGERIVGGFEAGEIISDDGTKTEKSFTIDMKINDDVCNYDIRPAGITSILNPRDERDKSIFSLDTAYKRFNWDQSDTEFIEQCEADTSTYITLKRRRVNTNCLAFCEYEVFCFKGIRQGWQGDISKSIPVSEVSIDITIESGIERYEGTITNVGGLSTYIDDTSKKAYAKLVGSLTTGAECPDSIDDMRVKGLYYKDVGWKVIDSTAFDDYWNYHLYNFADCVRDSGEAGAPDLQYCTSRYIELSNSALKEKTISRISQEPDVMKDTSVGEVIDILAVSTSGGLSTTGKLRLTMDYNILNPVVLLKIDADWIGVETPSGKPKITGVYSDTLVPKEASPVLVNITNIGSTYDVFDLRLICDSYLIPKGISSEVYLNAGGSTTTALYVTTGYVTAPISVSCELIANSRADPTVKHSVPITLNVNPAFIFPEGYEQCTSDSKNIKTFRSGKWVIITCPYGCEMVGAGDAKCSERERPAGLSFEDFLNPIGLGGFGAWLDNIMDSVGGDLGSFILAVGGQFLFWIVVLLIVIVILWIFFKLFLPVLLKKIVGRATEAIL